MSASPTQFTIRVVTEFYWRVTFNHPPINLATQETLHQLQTLVGQIEAAKDLRVVVFDSANPGYFIARYDLARANETMIAPGPTGLPLVTSARFEASPITIGELFHRWND